MRRFAYSVWHDQLLMCVHPSLSHLIGKQGMQQVSHAFDRNIVQAVPGLVQHYTTSHLGEPGPRSRVKELQSWHQPQLRSLSEIARAREDSMENHRNGITYEGPWSTAVKRCKNLSLFSTVSAFSAVPIILSLDAGGSAAATMGPKAGIAFTLCSFGAFTTGLLHWFTSPYIHRLEHDPGKSSITVTVLNLFARPVQYTIPLAEIAYPDTLRPQVSFQWKGKVFYVDSANFPDTQLLQLLSPPDPHAASPPGSMTENH